MRKRNEQAPQIAAEIGCRAGTLAVDIPCAEERWILAQPARCQGRERPGLAGAPGRPGRGAPKTSAPGRGAGRCKKTRGASWKHRDDDEYTVRLEGSNRVSMGRAAARSSRESKHELLLRHGACRSNYFLRLFSWRVEQAGWAEPG
jgi:hypothetical protein